MPQLQALQNIAEALNTKKTITDFVTAFSAVVELFKKMKAANEQERQEITITLTKLATDVREAIERASKLTDGKDGHTPTRAELEALILPLIPPPLEPREPDQVDVEGVIRTVMTRMPQPVIPNPRVYDDEISELKDTIAKLEQKIERNAGVRVIGGRAGVNLYTGSTKKGLAQTLNFVAGSGVTIAHSAAQGRNDITISSTGVGGGGFTVLDLATPDGTTTNFTVPAHTTLIVYLNGIMQRGGGIDYTDNGTSISFVVAPLGPPDIATPWLVAHYN